jgi:hypothetical protein
VAVAVYVATYLLHMTAHNAGSTSMALPIYGSQCFVSRGVIEDSECSLCLHLLHVILHGACRGVFMSWGVYVVGFATPCWMKPATQ